MYVGTIKDQMKKLGVTNLVNPLSDETVADLYIKQKWVPVIVERSNSNDSVSLLARDVSRGGVVSMTNYNNIVFTYHQANFVFWLYQALLDITFDVTAIGKYGHVEDKTANRSEDLVSLILKSINPRSYGRFQKGLDLASLLGGSTVKQVNTHNRVPPLTQESCEQVISDYFPNIELKWNEIEFAELSEEWSNLAHSYIDMLRIIHAILSSRELDHAGYTSLYKSSCHLDCLLDSTGYQIADGGKLMYTDPYRVAPTDYSGFMPAIMRRIENGYILEKMSIVDK